MMSKNIVIDETDDGLIAQVKILLRRGWQPLGNLLLVMREKMQVPMFEDMLIIH